MKPVVEENPGEDETWPSPLRGGVNLRSTSSRCRKPVRSRRLAAIVSAFRHERESVLPARDLDRGFTVLALGGGGAGRCAIRAVPPRAAQDLGDQAEHLGAFEFVERSGRTDQ